MIVAEPWGVYPAALDQDACGRIEADGVERGEKRGVGREGDLGKQRKTDIAWIGEEWIFDLVDRFPYKANEAAGWNFDVERMQSLQFGVYPVGGHYDWHFDMRGRAYGAGDEVHPSFH